jgi:hypothetical protein
MQTTYYEQNRDKFLAYQKERYQKNRAHIRQYQNLYFAKYYEKNKQMINNKSRAYNLAKKALRPPKIRVKAPPRHVVSSCSATKLKAPDVCPLLARPAPKPVKFKWILTRVPTIKVKPNLTVFFD